MCGACVGKEKNMKTKIMGMIAVTAALASMTAALPAYAAEGDPVTVQYTDVAMDPDTAFKVGQTVEDGAMIENGSVVLDGWWSANSGSDGPGYDNGDKNPRGYIEYQAPADGKVTFTFSGTTEITNNKKPRVYVWKGSYSNEIKKEVIDKGGKASFVNEGYIAQVDNSDPVKVSFDVVQGETYVIFGYMYRATTETYYTFSDFTFTGSFDAAETNKYTEPDVTDMVGFYGKAEGTGASGTVNLYVKNNDGQWSTNSLGTTISGDGDVNFGIIITGEDVDKYEAAYTVE